MNYLRNVMLGLLLVGLTGCGFHLRGSVQLPESLAVMRLMDAVPATDIGPELRRGLEEQGVEFMEGADMVLQLHGETFSRRVLSVDSQGRAQEYGLSYVVNFSLRDGGVYWLARESVTTARDLRFDAGAVLASGSEEERLKTEMIRDAVNSMLRRIQKARPPAE